MQKDMHREREREDKYNPIQRNLISLIFFFYQEEQIKKREEKLSDAPLPFLNIVN
jgi:hypothetical protein